MWLNIHAYVWRVIASYGFRFVLKNKYMTGHVEARLIRTNKVNLRKKLACVTKRRICMRTEFCTRSIKDVLFWRRGKIGYVVQYARLVDMAIRNLEADGASVEEPVNLFPEGSE